MTASNEIGHALQVIIEVNYCKYSRHSIEILFPISSLKVKYNFSLNSYDRFLIVLSILGNLF